MGTKSATGRLTSFFEVLTLIEIILVRLIMFALFIYGACHLARRLYSLDNPHTTSLNVPQIRPDRPSRTFSAARKNGER
jgi:hypothetical protein